MRYQIRHAIVRYGADTILEDVNFEIKDTEKIAVVGRNGCGKTTLLKLIAGEVKMDNLDSDEDCGISMAGTQRIGYLKQISFEDTEITVENEILKVFEPIFACEKRMLELTELMNESHDKSVMGEYSHLQDKMEALGIYEVAPEDFALCEFVDTSKLELQHIVRTGLDLLRKEME